MLRRKEEKNVKNKRKIASFIAVLPTMLFTSCTQEKPVTGSDQPTKPTTQTASSPISDGGCKPPDCHINPPPLKESPPMSEGR